MNQSIKDARERVIKAATRETDLELSMTAPTVNALEVLPLLEKARVERSQAVLALSFIEADTGS